MSRRGRSRSPEAWARRQRKWREKQKTRRRKKRQWKAWCDEVWAEYKELRNKLDRELQELKEEAKVQDAYKAQARQLVKDNMEQAAALGEDRDKYQALARARDYETDAKAATTELEIIGDVILQIFKEMADARALAERLTREPTTKTGA